MANVRWIDMDTYERKEQFDHFLGMYFPFVQVTVQVDITDLLYRVKQERLPFFLSFLYCLGRAANSVPELRRRIREEKILEYDVCRLSYTVSAPDGTYRYCGIRCDLPFDEYISKGIAAQQKAEQSEHLTEEDDPESYYFISSMPWTSFSGISMPFPDNRFSVPSFMMGKYTTAPVPVEGGSNIVFENRTTIPVCLQVHHSLVDGRHIGRFFDVLNDELQTFAHSV